MNKCFILFILFFSCKNRIQEESIQISILNDELYSLCSSNECKIPYRDYYRDDYISISTNRVIFKIENLTDNNLLLYSKNFDGFKIFLPSFNTFSNQLNVSLKNFLIFNSENKVLKPEIIMGEPRSKYIDRQEYIKNEVLKFYNTSDYSDKNDLWKFENNRISNGTLKIYSKQTLYFEALICFPFSSHNELGFETSYILDKDENYYTSLYFKFIKPEGVLRKSQKLEIENNKFDFFEGEIRSVNTVPLKIIKDGSDNNSTEVNGKE
ncbi:hypothetical protein C7H52_05620 [Aurantibacter aestuarii]|uniref:Uncharacterized protein n=2 Tax=Aurantibacter aestuarii TaxID=1266046 RepID=A0A2T1NE79_9FLAO|nr:hypothetical protein C7H52_05620 [Aurantibacter aestuarii]